MQARRRAQPSGTNSPSSSHPRWKAPSAMRDLLSVPAMRPPGSPRQGDLAGSIQRAAGERPPRARPQRRGSPGPIPNPAVKPAFAESTAAPGCGRAGRRARGGRFSYAHARPGRRVRRMRREGPAGGCCPLRAFPRFGGRLKAPFRVPGLGRRRRMRDIRRSRCRGPARRGVPAGRSFVRALRACSVLRCMRSV